MIAGSYAEFSKKESCFVTKNLMKELVQKALDNPLKKYRFCLHQNPESTLHEMVIVTTKDDMRYPDKHLGTTESNIILSGKLLVVFFGEEGEIQRVFVLDPEELFYYRCEKNQYHMTIPLTDVAVYVEIKEGPFDDKSNVFPKWAPERSDMESMRVFNEEMKRKAMDFMNQKNNDMLLK